MSFEPDQEIEFDKAVFLINSYELCAKANSQEFHNSVIPCVQDDIGWVEKCLTVALKNDNYPLVKHIASAQPVFLKELLFYVMSPSRQFDEITVWTLRKNEIQKDLLPNEILWCEIDCVRHCFYNRRADLIEIAIKRRKEMLERGMISPFTEKNVTELTFLDYNFTKSQFKDVKWL
jgi:hypothetical protein